MFYIFINGIYFENEESGIAFEDVNLDLKNRIVNETVNLEDALSKGFINKSEYEELENKYFCWRFSGTSGYKYDYLYPILRKEDGTIRDDIFDTFAFNDKSNVNVHFKNEFSQGFQFESLEEIINQGFTTQDEIDEMKLILDEHEAEVQAEQQKILAKKRVKQAELRHYVFAAIFDTNGIITDDNVGLEVSYDDVNKMFTCVIPEITRDDFQMDGDKPRYYLDIEPEAITGFKWQAVKRRESFDIFQVDSVGDKHDLEGLEMQVRAFYHEKASL